MINFDNAKAILRDATFKLGGELFTKEALRQIGDFQAKRGNDAIKKELDLVGFVEKIVGPIVKNTDYAQFYELVMAITVLSKYEEDQKKKVKSKD